MSFFTVEGARLGRGLWARFDGLAFPLKLVAYVCMWPLLELLFLFRVRRFLRLRTEQPPVHNEADAAEVERFWDRVLVEEDAEAVDAILRGWFLGHGPVLAGNLEELVAWSISREAVTTVNLGAWARHRCLW